MSFLQFLSGRQIPATLDELISVCDDLCNAGKYERAIKIAEKYGDRLFNRGNLRRPRQFYELGVSHLLAMAGAHGACSRLRGPALEDAISGIAARRRYVHDLLSKADSDPELSSEAQRFRDIADATVNDLQERFGSMLNVTALIVKADLMYAANSPSA